MQSLTMISIAINGTCINGLSINNTHNIINRSIDLLHIDIDNAETLQLNTALEKLPLKPDSFAL